MVYTIVGTVILLFVATALLVTRKTERSLGDFLRNIAHRPKIVTDPAHEPL